MPSIPANFNTILNTSAENTMNEHHNLKDHNDHSCIDNLVKQIRELEKELRERKEMERLG